MYFVANVGEEGEGDDQRSDERAEDDERQHAGQIPRRFVARHPGLKENSDSTFSSRNIQNNKGHLEGYLMAASGAKETVTYELTKEGGDWKIDDIKFDGEAALSAHVIVGDGTDCHAIRGELERILHEFDPDVARARLRQAESEALCA